MDFDLLLFDRINVIKDTINKFGEDNFYLSFSGGKDSTVLHYLLDMALPDNQIPRVFINTGIEYIDILKFVRQMAFTDHRIKISNAGVNIKKMLNEYGYPFKSKLHSTKIMQWQYGKDVGKISYSALQYKNDKGIKSKFVCPDILKYQYEDDFKLKLSPYCCNKMKKDTIHKWEKENNRNIAMTGMKATEGGQRENIINCIITKKNKVVKFHPLIKVNDEWEEWFINKYNIKLCKLYYEPYNFKRTGCKGCPFALNLQEELETMEKYLPNERKQCENIWRPVYEEYRRIGYRLRKNEQLKLI